MKKTLITISFSVLLLPSFALAAYNDVTLTTSAVIQVGSYTLNVSGTSAAIQSIVVNPTNFVVTLAQGSVITVSSPTFNQLSTDVTSDITGNTCNGSNSVLGLAYSGAGTVTNTITPSAMICTTLISSGGGSYSGGSSSGGGSYAPPAVLATISATSTATTTSFIFTIPLISGVSNTQVTSLQTLLTDLGFYNGPITGYFGSLTETALKAYQTARGLDPVGFVGPKTRAALTLEKIPATITTHSIIPIIIPIVSTTTSSSTFTRDLTLGSVGSDVTALQIYLNTHGYTIAASGNGSLGHETDSFGTLTQAALIRFQTDHGITPAQGYFGEKTRGYLSKY